MFEYEFRNPNLSPSWAGSVRTKSEYLATVFIAKWKAHQRTGLRYPPNNCWPLLMRADMAAAYLDERSVETFLKKIGSNYPAAFRGHGRRGVWTKASLDATSGNTNAIDDLSELI